MTVQSYVPSTFNATAIDGTGNIKALFHLDNGPIQSQRYGVVEATIPGLGDRDVRGQPQGSFWLLRVRLADASENNVQTMLKLFTHEAGATLPYLVALDGNGAAWRVQARVVMVEQVAGTRSRFIVTMRVADPRWQENAATTNSQLAQVASPVTATLVNNGNRRARALHTLKANAAKSINSMLSDYTASLQGFLVNRCPNDIVNKPVYLFDQTGAAARLGTDTGATGTTVQKTTGATQTTADPGAAGTSIAVTLLDGFNANGGLAILRWVTGSVFGTMECVSYAAKSAPTGAGNLTGCVRGLGGTTAQAHPSGATIGLCGTMPNGDDCRVWLDDVPDVTRYLVNWNAAGASADVVINVSLPAASTYTLVAAQTAALPANGGSFTINEDTSKLAAKGFLAINDEVIYYNAKAGRTFSGVQRAQWGTTAAVHALAANVWANPRHFVVATGYAAATPPPAPTGQRPCIQLAASNNQNWKWGNEALDPLTVYFDRNAPDRTAQWVPGFDLDGNTISPLMSLSASGVIATFKDDVPGDGSPPVNFLELAVPMGIQKAAVAAIQNDWTPTAELLNLELFVRDAGGTLKLADQLQQTAAAVARALPAALGSTGYGVKLKGRYSVGTGHRGTGSELDITNTVNFGAGSAGQKIVFNSDQKVSSVTLLIRRGGANQDITVQILGELNGAPGPTTDLNTYFRATATVSNAAATLQTITSETPVIVKAGTYWLTVDRLSPQTNQIFWTYRASSRRYRANCFAQQLVGAVWSNFAAFPNYPQFYFLINGTYLNDGTAPINSDDQPVSAVTTALRSGVTASFDKTVITIEPSQAIYVHRTGAFAATLFHANGVLTNPVTGDTIAYDKWMTPPLATLAVDCELRTVTYTEAGVATPVTKAITPSNTADWLPLSPGSNGLTYVDASLISPGSLDLVSVFRGCKV